MMKRYGVKWGREEGQPAGLTRKVRKAFWLAAAVLAPILAFVLAAGAGYKWD